MSRRGLTLRLIPLTLLLLTGGVAIGRPEPEKGKESHRLFGDEWLETSRNPQDIMNRRLAGLKKPDEDSLRKLASDPEMLKLARQLLQDKKFVESVKNSLSPDDIQRLGDMIRRNENLGDDETFRKLAESLMGLAGPTSDMKDLVETLKDRIRTGKTESPTRPPTDPATPPNSGNPPSQPPAQQPPPETMQRPPATPNGTDPSSNDSFLKSEWMRDGLRGAFRNLDRWVGSDESRRWSDQLKSLAQRFENARPPRMEVPDSAKNLVNSLPRFSNFVPRGGIPGLRPPSLPSAPRFGIPSLPSQDGGKAILILAVVVGLLVLIWRFRGLLPSVVSNGKRAFDARRWPVSPDAIVTRADLVRAFEHLALACLGATALPRHHNDLARRMAAQASLDPDRRKEALDTVARLYETARYTPDEERLPEADIALARREMTLLARSLVA